MNTSVESTLLRTAISTHEKAVERLDAIVNGLSDRQANWQPAPKKWSVAECVEHLNQTLGTYMERMAPAMAKARVQGRTGGEPYGRGTLAGRFLVDFLKQPSKRVRAPGVFSPGARELAIDEVAQTFGERCARFIDLAKEADGLALGSVKIATPVNPLLRLSLAQAFEVHTLHTPRHLAQAEKVTQHEAFPTS